MDYVEETEAAVEEFFGKTRRSNVWTAEGTSAPAPKGMHLHPPLFNDDVCNTVLSWENLSFVVQLHRHLSASMREATDIQMAARKSLVTAVPGQTSSNNSGVAGRIHHLTNNQIRSGNWHTRGPTEDLGEMYVSLTTSSACRKRLLGGLKSGADVVLADLEDGCVPYWSELLAGQINLHDSLVGLEENRKHPFIHFQHRANICVRVRGLQVFEPINQVSIDSDPVSAALWDVGLYMALNWKFKHFLPHFCIPKIETPKDAAVWAELFTECEQNFHLPKGTIRVTLLVESVLAVLLIEEIVYELRDYMVAALWGRGDYCFDLVQLCRRMEPNQGERFHCPLTEKDLAATNTYFEYVQKVLVECGRRRRFPVIAGNATVLPPDGANTAALVDVLKPYQRTKEREAAVGHYGTWVPHPKLISYVRTYFRKMDGEPPSIELLPGKPLPLLPDWHPNYFFPDASTSENVISLSNYSTSIRALLVFLKGYTAGQTTIRVTPKTMAPCALMEGYRSMIQLSRDRRLKTKEGEYVTDAWIDAELQRHQDDPSQLLLPAGRQYRTTPPAEAKLLCTMVRQLLDDKVTNIYELLPLNGIFCLPHFECGDIVDAKAVENMMFDQVDDMGSQHKRATTPGDMVKMVAPMINDKILHQNLNHKVEDVIHAPGMYVHDAVHSPQDSHLMHGVHVVAGAPGKIKHGIKHHLFPHKAHTRE